MTDESLATLQTIGASLKHVGAAIAESLNHAGSGSTTPLQPLDLCLAVELPNLRREGQATIADALVALRASQGAMGNG